MRSMPYPPPPSQGSFTEPSARIEALLAGFAPQLGRDLPGYGNHVRRVFGLVRAQGPHLTPAELVPVEVAAVFHDIAIWLDGTFDYLEPSRDHAASHLRAEGLDEHLPLVSALIMGHHKLRPVRDAPLVEAFRRADLCDVSFGLVGRGIPRGAHRALTARHPVCGFQLRLLQFAATQARKEPLRPLPMLRW